MPRTHIQCKSTTHTEKVLLPLGPALPTAVRSCAQPTISRHLATMPLTPPSDFLKAINRPILMASLMETGTCALAKNSAAWKKRWKSLARSRRGCKCSTVIPVGPPVGRQQISREEVFIQNELHTWLQIGHRGWYRHACGPRSLGFIPQQIQCVQTPGATSAPSSACLAEATFPCAPTLQLDLLVVPNHSEISGSCADGL